MRITYRQLRNMLHALTDEQLDMDVTYQDFDLDECFAVSLMISDHDSLDENHPVIYCPTQLENKHIWDC